MSESEGLRMSDEIIEIDEHGVVHDHTEVTRLRKALDLILVKAQHATSQTRPYGNAWLLATLRDIERLAREAGT